MEGVVEAVVAGSVMSLAVSVQLPTVRKVTLRILVPATRAVSEGRIGLGAVEVILAVWVTELTRFQLSSTALTVTLKAAPAVLDEGEPVFPLEVPGEAISPGPNNWSFVNAPALTATSGLIFA